MADTQKESTATAQTSPNARAALAPLTGTGAGAGTGAAVASPTSPTTSIPLSPVLSQEQQARRGSDEWDASKVPPSRFQKRKGSIYAVPPSRDGRVDHSYTERYDRKLAELGYTNTK